MNIPSDVVQAVHDYLMTRPMNEVEALVMAIRQECTPVKDGSSKGPVHENAGPSELAP